LAFEPPVALEPAAEPPVLILISNTELHPEEDEEEEDMSIPINAEV
jgi:hypothetical protein